MTQLHELQEIPDADPTRNSPVGFTARERRHLALIERRIAHLVEIEDQVGPAARDWNRAEVAALRWALTRIAQVEREEKERESRWNAHRRDLLLREFKQEFPDATIAIPGAEP